VLDVPRGRFLLQTMRSHDQFNTTIYGLDDRYRGVKGGRRVVFVNPDDLRDLGMVEGATVDLVSEWRDGVERHARSFRVVPYDQPRGCVAAYYPEANPLVPLDSTAEASNQPVYKSIVVRLDRPGDEGSHGEGSSHGSADQGSGSTRDDHPHHLS
jgi:formate dehydrogenase major subunit